VKAIMRRHRRVLVFATVIGCLPTAAGLAQSVTRTAEPSVTPGWTFTPSIQYGQIVDDNVLIQGKGAAVSGDLLSVITPSASLDFNGRRGHVSADYSGSYELYRQFDSLDNFSQFQAVSARRLLTQHTTLSVQQQFAMTPTTELPALAGIPYVRDGSRVLGLRAGIEHEFTKRTTLSAYYNFQKIAFDKDPVSGLALVGGVGNGATVDVRHEMTAQAALRADYDLQVASVLAVGASTIHNLRAGGEYKFSATSSVYALGGIARLGPNALTAGHTGPSWEAGATHRLGRAAVDVTYIRSFMPSFGNGATLQSDDVGAHLRMTPSRRLYTQGSVDWRQDDPLAGTFTAILGEQRIRSLLFSGLVGYPANRWLRIEGFFTVSRQKINRPGGDVDINRAGIQVVTIKPTRLR
jgi:hypothetical protein